MRSNNFVTFFLVWIGLLFSPLSLADNEVKKAEKNKASNLCDTGDLIFFACTTKNKKIISLCGKGTKDKPTGVYYRFGRTNKIEMDFPENKDESSFLKFSYDYYFRYRVKLESINFINNGYSYSIYDDYRDDDPEEKEMHDIGLVVNLIGASKKIVNIKCKSGIYNSLSGIQEKVPHQE
jgi:hypothetical protein